MDDARTVDMRRLRRAGLTLEAIGARYSVSKQRVMQILGEPERVSVVITHDSEGARVTSDLDPDTLATRIGQALSRLGDDVTLD